MRNIWIICRKELRSYFVSPIAYLLLTMFAVIFGFFFWNSLGYFVIRTMEAPGDWLSRAVTPGRRVIGYRHVHLDDDEEPDHRWRRNLRSLPAAVGAGMGQRIRDRHLGASSVVFVCGHAL